MGQARARFRRSVENGEKAWEAMHRAQEIFAQAQQEVLHAKLDLEKLMQEASMPIPSATHVSASLVKTEEALKL